MFLKSQDLTEATKFRMPIVNALMERKVFLGRSKNNEYACS